MSGIGKVGAADLNAGKLQQKTTKAKPEAQNEPQDKVDIKKDISKPRKVFEKLVGSPVGLVTMAGKTVGGFFGGGTAAVTGDRDDAATPLGISSGLAYTAAGAGAGLMLMGGWIPAVVGGAVGLGFGILSGASGSMEKIGDKVGDKAVKASSDNQPSQSKVKDTVMNFTEGSIVGAIHGGVEGLKQGTAYGAGIVSGVIEGTKGAVGSVIGTHTKKEAADKPDAKKEPFYKRALKAVASVPRKLTRFIAGTATGAAGSALSVIDGAIQGTVLGVDSDEKASAGAHRVIRGLQMVVAGGVAGAAFAGGGWMIAAGAGAGALAGAILGKITKATDADKKYAEGFTNAVRHAQQDNVYKEGLDEYGDRDKSVYESFRDGIEGSMTGVGAGVHEGFKEGYQAGAGIVDGVFDAGKGILKGVAGGISGAAKKE